MDAVGRCVRWLSKEAELLGLVDGDCSDVTDAAREDDRRLCTRAPRGGGGGGGGKRCREELHSILGGERERERDVTGLLFCWRLGDARALVRAHSFTLSARGARQASW